MVSQPADGTKKGGRRQEPRIYPSLMSFMWILDSDHNPLDCSSDLELWSEWMCSHERRIVGRDYIGDTLVSTVFLGAFNRYETMAFAEEPYDGMTTHSDSWQQAEKDHAAMCVVIRALQEKAKKGGDATDSGLVR